MLSCKNCGAEMSGIDLVCKKCGTPWGKKRKSRKGLYLSSLIIIAVSVGAYIYYIPGAKEQFMTFYNDVLAAIPADKKNNIENNNDVVIDEGKNINENVNNENEVTPPPEENEIVPPADDEIEITPLPPVFNWVSASSSLKNYESELTTDKKLETAWLEGVKGNGIGEWIMYSSESDQTVSSITIYNGYLKNDKVYINNGRIRKLSLEFSDGEIITKDIPKSNYSTAKKGYTITLEKPKQTTSVKITILDAYQGAYYTDTGISGISFN